MQQIIQKNYFKHRTADASIYQIDIKVTTLLKIALDFLVLLCVNCTYRQDMTQLYWYGDWDRIGQYGIAQDCSGQQRIAQYSTGLLKVAQDSTGFLRQDSTGQNKIAQESTGQDCSGWYRIVQNSTGQDRDSTGMYLIDRCSDLSPVLALLAVLFQMNHMLFLLKSPFALADSNKCAHSTLLFCHAQARPNLSSSWA